MLIESIKNGWNFVAENLKLASIAAGLYIVIGLCLIPFQLKMADVGPDPEAIPGGLLAGALIAYLAIFLINVFFQGGILGSAKAFIQKGQAAVADFLQCGMRFYRKLLGFTLLLVVALLAYWMIVMLLGWLLSLLGFGNATATNIIFVAVAVSAGVVALVALLGILFSPFAIVHEELGVFAAIKNSWALAKSNKVTIILLALFLLLAGLLLSGVLYLVNLGLGGHSVWLGVVSTVINNIVGTLFGFLVAGTIMNLYRKLAA